MSDRIVVKQLLAGVVVAGGILCLGIAGADAADIASRYTKAAAAAGAVWDWTGFYLGADVGGTRQTAASGSSDFFQSGDRHFLQTQSPSSSAVLGGIHLGYNWQIAHVVLGLEGDWQWAPARSSFCRQVDTLSLPCSDNSRGFVTVDSETRGIGTVRGRLGYAFDRVLVYGTGGAAFVDVRESVTANCQVAGCALNHNANLSVANSSTLKIGWVAGAGAEFMLSPNWTVRSEYLHADIGTVSSTLNLAPENCVAGGPCGASWSRSQHYDIGRIGLSYKFGGGTRID
jgi:outer membrane immunogenic protein